MPATLEELVKPYRDLSKGILNWVFREYRFLVNDNTEESPLTAG